MRIAQAAKAYENHVAENGQPDDHAKAKEILYVVSSAYRSVGVLTDIGFLGPALLALSSTARSRPRVSTSSTGRRPSTRVRRVLQRRLECELMHIFTARRQCEEAYDNQYL